MHIEGATQEVLYGGTTLLTTRLDIAGVEITTVTTCTIALYDPDGDVLVAATAMTQVGTTSEWKYSLDASSTTTYPLAQDYRGEITFVVSTITYKKQIWFDVVRHPFLPYVLVTDELIDRKHPDWIGSHPSGNTGTWYEPIISAHAEVSERLRKMDKRVSLIIKREQLFKPEFAFACYFIAVMCGFPDAEIKRWKQEAEDSWAAIGPFTYDIDDDLEVDTDADSDGLIGGEDERAIIPRRTWET